MKPGKKRRERLTGEQRRARIIDVALNLFSDKGFSGTRTRDIAHLAGISETLIFQHFKTKQELYHAALRELFRGHPAIAEIEDRMARKDDAGVLSTLALHMITHSREDPRIIRLSVFSALEGPHLREGLHTGGQTTLPVPEVLASYIQQRIDDGAFKKVNAQIAARLFIQTVDMYVVDQQVGVTGPPLPVSDEEAVETLVKIFLEGLGA